MGRSMPLLPWCQQYALEMSAINISLNERYGVIIDWGCQKDYKVNFEGMKTYPVPFLALVSKRWHYDNANNDFDYKGFTYNIIKDVLTWRDLVLSNCISSN